jgi:hypothetical protein
MDKRALRKVILGQLAAELRTAVIIDGDNMSEEDLARADDVQHELAEEFERRAQGGRYSPEWDKP